MKKRFYAAALLFALALLFTACASPSGAVLPPVRYGTKGTAQVSLEKAYTFETAYAEADMVAHVRIGNWLSEDNENGLTCYQAAVIKQYKGENLSQIVLKQDGSSQVTLKNYPLFTAGNEFLLFLKKGIDADTYWIEGAYTTMLDVVADDSGEEYFIDRYGMLGETIKLDADTASQRIPRTQLRANAVKADSVYGDFTFLYVFKKTDLEQLLEQFK